MDEHIIRFSFCLLVVSVSSFLLVSSSSSANCGCGCAWKGERRMYHFARWIEAEVELSVFGGWELGAMEWNGGNKMDGWMVGMRRITQS